MALVFVAEGKDAEAELGNELEVSSHLKNVLLD